MSAISLLSATALATSAMAIESTASALLLSRSPEKTKYADGAITFDSHEGITICRRGCLIGAGTEARQRIRLVYSHSGISCLRSVSL